MLRAVVDTNVFISGVFFCGPPYEILDSWRHQIVQLVYSAEILAEYIRVGQRLAERYPEVDIDPLLALVVLDGELVAAPPLKEPVCIDAHDDKFFSCAIASNCSIIISGDKHLLQVSRFKGIDVICPRDFVEKHLPR